MRGLPVMLLMLILCGAASADMGYFGSITQNPVPVGDLSSHPSIELTCEDVFIEVFPRGDARLTAAFLFHNGGPMDDVMMYFPVSVMVPTISVLWSMENLTDPLGSPAVTVDGKPVEVRPMLAAMWHDGTMDRGWEELAETVDLLSSAPSDSGTVFFTVDPGYWENLDMMERVSSDSLPDLDLFVLGAGSSNALWTVHFNEGADVLVEYTMDLTLRAPGESEPFSLSYPLYTGASWAGPIGSGRITVVPSRGLSLSDFTAWSSFSMPEARVGENMSYLGLPELEGHPSYRGSLMEAATGVTLPEALVWEFADFEPVVSPRGWTYYFEDPMAEITRCYTEMIYGCEAPPPWPSSLRVVVADASPGKH
jgi:hypothetical protein